MAFPATADGFSSCQLAGNRGSGSGEREPSELDNREFYYREAGEYEHGPPTPEPSGELSCEWPYVAKLAESSMKMVRFRL